MLILDAKPGLPIYIGDSIVIHISDVRGGKVRLAVDAPEGVRVVRKEVADAAERK